jgi:hypothetical protein
MQYTPYNPGYVPPERSPWRTLIIIVLLIVVVAAVIIGYFVFTAKPPPDGYMNREDSLSSHALRYLHWSEVNGQVSGYWTIAEVKSVDAKPIYGTGAIKGSHSGNIFNLMFYYPNGGSEASTAILDNNTLTLQSPAGDGTVDTLIFRGVAFKEYSQELNDFKALYS